MQTLTDPQLLRAYAQDHSEAAFGELVRRHIDLTYSVALRIVRDTHLAEDATQAVFVALAQNAATLADHPVLSGWLHCATRNVASQIVRSEVRRRAREQEAATMQLSPDTDAPWQEVEPHLDSILAELDPAERDAILLRYFEQKSARDMATQLGISAEAAQKRVSRAVEHLRNRFARRGITVTTAGIAGLIASHAVQAAPTSLATTVAAAARLATTASASTAFPDSGTPDSSIPGDPQPGDLAGILPPPGISFALLPKLLAGAAAVTLAAYSIHATIQNHSLRRQVQQLGSRPSTRGPATQALARPTASNPPSMAIQPFPSDGPGTAADLIQDPSALNPVSPPPVSPRASASSGSASSGTASGNAFALTHSHLEAISVNGLTTLRYGNLEIPLGTTRGPVTTRAVQLQGREYAAAFDGDRVLWENVPGAAQRLR